MSPRSIPEDIVRTIVEQIPQDRPTLKALATVAKIFTDPCQEILFQRLVINFRRRNLEKHVLDIHGFLTAKPSLRPYIHHLEIIDNNITSAHKRETSAPLGIEISSADLYSSQELWLNRNIYYALLFDNDRGSFLPHLLDYLSNLSSISISIKHIPCSWLHFTPALGKSLIRLFQTPGLRKLYIQGLMFIPILALANFRDLNELYIKECDLDCFNYNLGANCATRKLDDRKEMRRLAVLTVQELPASSFQALLNHWQNNTDPGFIDMSSPRELTIYISTFRELSLVENLLQMCQEVIETLRIHTWGLNLGTSFFSPSLWLGFEINQMVYDSFYHVMEPLGLVRPCRLVKLTLSVSFWINTDFPEANGELEWALEMLREIPPNHNLKEITVNIRVGGERQRDLLAFVDFQRYRGWKNWDRELSGSKWKGVDMFLFLVCCDCGPKLRMGTDSDDIQWVIARQMPLLAESGKLSTGHALLGDEGLMNHDIVRWICE
jgi:hypothetical protein